MYTLILSHTSVNLHLQESRALVTNHLPERLSERMPPGSQIVNYLPNRFITVAAQNPVDNFYEISLFDKECTLLWHIDRKFFENQDLPSWALLAYNIEISDDAKYIQFYGKSESGCQAKSIIFIRKKQNNGYEKVATHLFCGVYAPSTDEQGRTYTAGHFPDADDSRCLEAVCFSAVSGDIVWRRMITSIGYSDPGKINVSKNCDVIQISYQIDLGKPCQTRNDWINNMTQGMTLLGREGNILLNVTHMGIGGCIALTDDGQTSALSVNDTIYLYSSRDGGLLSQFKLMSDQKERHASVDGIAVSSDSTMVAIIISYMNDEGRDKTNSQLLICDIYGIELCRMEMESSISIHNMAFSDNNINLILEIISGGQLLERKYQIEK